MHTLGLRHDEQVQQSKAKYPRRSWRPAGPLGRVKMRFVIDGVGIAQRNGYRDVLVVQQLLNMNLGLLNRHHYLPLHPIDETGMFDRPTSELLRAYCRSVDPCGPTVIGAPARATEIVHAVRMPAGPAQAIVTPREFPGLAGLWVTWRPSAPRCFR